MGINNSSGRPVEYEVEPSNPDFGGPIAVSAALTLVGGGLTAYGCLADLDALTVVGLFLLLGALLADLYAYRQAQGSTAPAQGGEGSGKILIADGAAVTHPFAPGTWVVFTEVGDPTKVLAVSPPIFQETADVTLRRCGPAPPPQQLALTGADHVAVDPIEAATFV